MDRARRGVDHAGAVAGVFCGGLLDRASRSEATIDEALQFGASVWLWGVVIRTVLVWHVTWCGNSFPHLFGYRNYETNDNSRNNAWVAIITSGEGWHNNHHAEPGSASNQRHWWEIDLTYLLLRLLVLLGLAWDVQLPKRCISPASDPTSTRRRAPPPG